MGRTSQHYDFTSNDELDAMTAGDPTVEIRGYVDSIEGTKVVGKGKKNLYKFVLNNGEGRRIRVLLWEGQAVTYEPLIISKMIVHITRGKALPVNPQFVVPGDDLLPFEISVQRNTIIDLEGTYGSDEVAESETFEKIELANVMASDGFLVSVEGYIKVPFEAAIAGSASYGSGAITDGYYKLRVQIAQFQDKPDLAMGVHVTVQGEMRRDKFDSVYLQIKDMTHISVLEKKKMTVSELRSGFRSPTVKRSRDESTENDCPLKKDKLD